MDRQEHPRLGSSGFLLAPQVFWLLLASVAAAQDEEAPAASGTLVSSRPELDFGDILQSEQKTETLTLTNTGPVPVEIVRIESGCGCVVARRRVGNGEVALGGLDRRRDAFSLGPDEQVTLAIELDGRGRMGKVERALKIYTARAKRAVLTVPVRARVRRGYTIEPPGFLFGSVSRKEEPSLSVTLRFSELLQAEIARIVPPAPFITVSCITVSCEKVAAADTPQKCPHPRTFRIEATIGEEAPYGTFIRPLVIETTNERLARISVPLSVYVRPEVLFETGRSGGTERLDFGVLDGEKPVTRSITITNTRPEIPYRIRKVQVSREISQDVTLRPHTLEPGVSYRLDVTVLPSIEGPFFEGAVEITADHPDLPVKRIPVRGWIKKDANERRASVPPASFP